MIAETAKIHKFDLIMVSTHAGRFRRLLLGSTGESAQLHGRPGIDHGTRRDNRASVFGAPEMGCAIGLSADSERVLRYAKDAALAAKSDLSLARFALVTLI